MNQEIISENIVTLLGKEVVNNALMSEPSMSYSSEKELIEHTIHLLSELLDIDMSTQKEDMEISTPLNSHMSENMEGGKKRRKSKKRSKKRRSTKRH